MTNYPFQMQGSHRSSIQWLLEQVADLMLVVPALVGDYNIFYERNTLYKIWIWPFFKKNHVADDAI